MSRMSPSTSSAWVTTTTGTAGHGWRPRHRSSPLSGLRALSSTGLTLRRASLAACSTTSRAWPPTTFSTSRSPARASPSLSTPIPHQWASPSRRTATRCPSSRSSAARPATSPARSSRSRSSSPAGRVSAPTGTGLFGTLRRSTRPLPAPARGPMRACPRAATWSPGPPIASRPARWTWPGICPSRSSATSYIWAERGRATIYRGCSHREPAGPSWPGPSAGTTTAGTSRSTPSPSAVRSPMSCSCPPAGRTAPSPTIWRLCATAPAASSFPRPRWPGTPGGIWRGTCPATSSSIREAYSTTSRGSIRTASISTTRIWCC